MARRFPLPSLLRRFRRRRDPSPRCRSGLSQHVSLEGAVAELAVQLGAAAADQPADLALVFCSTAYASDLQRLLPLLRRQIPARHWIGCAGGGVVGTAAGQPRELEHQPAISVTLLDLPGAEPQQHRQDREQPDEHDPTP
mgnify:CR=1 FL=1